MTGRVTVTLPDVILAKLDDDVRQGRNPNRSAAIATVLGAYYAKRAEDLVREETIAYYRGLSEKEKAEDGELAQASARAASRLVKDEEQPKRALPAKRAVSHHRRKR